MTCLECGWPRDNPAHVYGCTGEIPLGVMPRVFWVERRVKEIDAAIVRYVAAGYNVPGDWLTEREDHIEYLRRVYDD